MASREQVHASDNGSDLLLRHEDWLIAMLVGDVCTDNGSQLFDSQALMCMGCGAKGNHHRDVWHLDGCPVTLARALAIRRGIDADPINWKVDKQRRMGR